MAFCRICNRRRLLGLVRRPYTVFMIGLILLYVSFSSLLLTKIGVMREFITGEEVGRTRPSRFVLPVYVNVTASIVLTEKRLREMKQKINPRKFSIHKPGTPNDTYFRHEDLVPMQAERQERIRRTCDVKHRQEKGVNPLGDGESVYTDGWYSNKFLYKNLEVYRPQNFLFCPVLKVGSTFFHRLFYAFGTEKTISSPFDISISTALKYKHGNLAEIAQWSKTHPRRSATVSLSRTSEGDKLVEDFLRNAGKAMFTRDPYSKLLSGYVDKLYAPNPYYWTTIGRVIVKTFRKNASAKSLRCGHDVTFPEFVKFVIKNEDKNSLHRDPHFAPSFDQCKPCRFKYDFIGKMETFPQDISLLVQQLGFNLSQSKLREWSRQSEMDAILDSINSPYGWRRNILKCISWTEANRRIWRKLAIRGVLDKNDGLPLSNFPQHTSNGASFIHLVSGYWERFKATGRKSAQKAEGLSSAYSLVPREDLEKLRKYFLLDFDLFGYDSRPASVFEAKQTWDVFNLNK